jgi:hypothetical protein
MFMSMSSLVSNFLTISFFLRKKTIYRYGLATAFQAYAGPFQSFLTEDFFGSEGVSPVKRHSDVAICG